MAKVTTYSNSKFATFLSILGYIAIVFGVYAIFHEDLEVVVGIIGLVIGIGLKVLASFISQKKSEKEAKKNQDV
jgi:uncharacterized membrane-anchored protein